MSQIKYRANLISGHMPFTPQLHGRTVIVPGKDQAFANNVLQTVADEDKDKGFPQVYYADNVVANGEGLQSVGYNEIIAGITDSVDFDDAFVMRDEDENKFLFSPANNKNYVYDATVGSWAANLQISPIASNKLITVAYIAGNTYVFFDGLGCFEYSTSLKKFVTRTLIGLDITQIHGITESNGFLIAWGTFTIYRSQFGNELDFTPDVNLGSGSSIPEDLNGTIVACFPTIGGFIIYCTKNAVGASFSQNIRFPFIYKEIKNSSGIAQARHVAWQFNTGEHYAWTQSGLMKVNRSEAMLVFAQLTDYLTSKLFEEFDTLTDAFIITKLTSQLHVRLSMVTSRWLAVSFGVSKFTHVWVYDLAFKRWGKLKRTHAAIFELYRPNYYEEVSWDDLGTLSWDDLGDTTWDDFSFGLDTVEFPKEVFALLLEDGTVETVNFDTPHTNDEGVLILGKYQFVRERWISLQDIEVENVEQNYNYTLKIISTVDGKNIYRVTTPYLSVNSGTYRKYNSTAQGLNQSLLAIGTFHFNSVEMAIKIEGRR